MPVNRITMAEVARVAKVHQTTVSLALRNDPRLPAATRARIRALAEKLGYRPDPMLSALNFYRASRDAIKTPPAMALVQRERGSAPAMAYYPDEQFLKGARRACDRLGYRLAVFQVGSAPGEGARLNRILRSRGIDGVIIGSLDASVGRLQMDWDHFSALCIESQHLGLSLHTVGNDQARVTRTAVRQLHAKGYRRIGLAVGETEETALKHAFTAGYLVEVHNHQALRRIPPLLLQPKPGATLVAQLGAWIRRHRIDAVLSNWNTTPAMIKAAGLRIPRDVSVATLDHNPRIGPVAGIRQSHDLVGERAVEALALLMKTNQKGQIARPNTTLVDGFWADGPDLPEKAKR